jgi:hypothetical protein
MNDYVDALFSLRAADRFPPVQVIFTNTLQRKLPGTLGIDCIAIHPGMVLTHVARTLPSVIQKAQKVLLSKILFTPSQGESYGRKFLKRSVKTLRKAGLDRDFCKPWVDGARRFCFCRSISLGWMLHIASLTRSVLSKFPHLE